MWYGANHEEMPFKGTPTCSKCGTEESPIWSNVENLGAMCLNCVNESKKSETPKQIDNKNNDAKVGKKKRTTRSYKTGANCTATPKANVARGKGRRIKRTPIKAPEAVATPVTSNSVFFKGSYFQVGDVVSMIDNDGGTYYAQLRGFLTDQYCEKSACVTWLLPTKHSPPPEEKFDPATYIIGPEEDTPRKLECMDFIMHAPSDYYYNKNTPYPPAYSNTQGGFVWTNLDPVQRRQSTT
ncbi:hypothetical protein FQA39_LY09826 [Lamprigera yunnana]|nr:hypothetical protein FQA39_LY09826 [Lamprigera yunnana]